MFNLIDNIYVEVMYDNIVLARWGGNRDKRGVPRNIERKYYSDYPRFLNGLTKILVKRDIAASESLEDMKERISNTLDYIDAMAYDFKVLIDKAAERAEKKIEDEEG